MGGEEMKWDGSASIFFQVPRVFSYTTDTTLWTIVVGKLPCLSSGTKRPRQLQNFDDIWRHCEENSPFYFFWLTVYIHFIMTLNQYVLIYTVS